MSHLGESFLSRHAVLTGRQKDKSATCDLYVVGQSVYVQVRVAGSVSRIHLGVPGEFRCTSRGRIRVDPYSSTFQKSRSNSGWRRVKNVNGNRLDCCSIHTWSC